ncbi:hypothetical protein NC653_012758 [Populus alba x Populus x berolinensis]|uniref:Uncharacterized protein n=1 Tax=Populus alba x Populus x berolinensis TaxID=444605 RepID=A0AAD6QSS0_9ROSI|nr:hypothetical protein NC653_012758 [Populus alba x Populus x berolinensis]
MASLLVSISFPMPLSAPKFSFKELQLRKSAVTRLSGQATSGTATNLLVPCNATGEILSVNQSCDFDVEVNIRNIDRSENDEFLLIIGPKVLSSSFYGEITNPFADIVKNKHASDFDWIFSTKHAM